MTTSLLTLALIVCVSTNALAQVDRATLIGIVTDPSDAVLTTAQVKVTSLSTNAVATSPTTAEGIYLVLNLAPGEHLVQVDAAGFKRFEQTVKLELGARARLDVSLAIGSLDQTITVEGVVPLLNAENAVVGTVVDRNEIAKLPLAIRNWDDLLALAPGVQSDRYTEQTGGGYSGRTGGFNVHGHRSLQNNFLLDGVANNSFSTNVQELSTQISRPSVDAIDEFKVVTSPYAAEYGWSPGAAVVVNTKSGSKTLRGTAYDFFRNDSLDAVNFFAKRAGQPKATNHQNQFGGNLGGAIIRGRAFFFADFEATRIEQGVLRTGRVMTMEERRGAFSGAIRDPLSGQDFPGNTIPTDRIDPVAARIVALLPVPNTSGVNNFIRQPNVDDRSERYLARVDSPLGGDNVFVRYIHSDRSRYVPGFFGGILDGATTSSWGFSNLTSHAAVIGWTKVLGSMLVNEARVSWARSTNDGTQDSFGVDGNAQIGFHGVPNDPRVIGGITTMGIAGHLQLGSAMFTPKFQRTQQFQYLNTLTWLRGRHQWKFGADILAPMRNEYFDVSPTRGLLNFTGQFTGNGFADFLLGYAQRALITNVWVVNQRLWSTSFFAQDDWKVSDAFTVNLGLRYDFMTPPLEADNRMANFDPSGAGSLVFARDGSLAARSLVRPDTNNFSPRAGTIYKLNDRTLLRGGYGVFYNQFERIGSEDQLALNPPGLRNIDLAASGSLMPALLLRDGFPANVFDNLALGTLFIRGVDPNAPRTMVQQFGGGIERQLGQAFTVSADVVGSVTQNLAVLRNLNQPLPGTLDANGPRPYPTFGTSIQWREMTGTGTYRGLDLGLAKRFRNGHSYRVSYTLGRSRDNANEHFGGEPDKPQNGRDLASWEGPSNFDVRHRVVGSVVAELPFGRGKPALNDGLGSRVLGGWMVSGIFSARTGRAFTVTQSSNNVGGLAAGLPNLIADPVGPRTVEQWYNKSAFELVPVGQFGNEGRNLLRGPGWATLDLSLQRRLDITPRWNTTARLDMFNVLNCANFGLPDRNIASVNAAVISTLAGDPRVMQVSLRVAF